MSESTTLAITARAAEMRAQGRPVLSLSAGEPDFGTPEAVARAGIAAIEAGLTGYTAAAGLPELRRAIAAHLGREYGLAYEPAEVCVTASVKPALSLALTALLEPGDKVVIQAPYWVSYPDIVRLAGGEPAVLETGVDGGFLPTEDALAEAMAAEGVRGILLNTPSNPTGAVWDERLLTTLVGLCRERDQWILSDEIYSRVVYEGWAHRSPAAIPGGHELTIHVDGLSKAYAMTGWRIGWIAGPREPVAAIAAIQSHVLGNAPTVSQYAALEALSERGSAYPQQMLEAFAERRAWLIEAVGALPGFRLSEPRGAFYLFPDVSEVCARRGTDDVALARTLLEEVEVAVVPGTAFGSPGHLRLSFAASLGVLQAAIGRIADWLAR
ncbi:MAG: pyridoxal phosphate-dependent aminotransferase [Planctomycetota bacterium]